MDEVNVLSHFYKSFQKMSQFQKNTITLILLFSSCLTFSQDTLTTRTMVGGTWSICTSTKFSKKFQCTKGYTSFEFFEDGTYKQNQKRICNKERFEYASGKWKMARNILTIEENDIECQKNEPRTYKIIWLDNNRFYVKGREGRWGPRVYTYYQRSL